MKTITVWDWPVRAGHWLLVGSFIVAWVTGESERWRLVHVLSGSLMASLIVFRVLWGLVGTRHARFASFVRGPGAVVNYLRSLLAGHPEHHTGHNPAGGWAIVALLGLGLLGAATGWGAYQELSGEWLEELHEGVVHAMLLLVIVHVAAVVLSSRLHHENLTRAMLTGRKLGEPGEAIAGTRAWALPVLLLWAATATWWLAR
jgi:cytochrome b